MQKKKKKYTKHKLNLNQIIIKSSFLTIAQLRSTNISQWISAKQEFLKYNVKIKLCSVSLLKKYSILYLNENGLSNTSNYDSNLYQGNVVLLYSNTSNREQLSELVKTIVNTEFFIPLFVYFQKRLQSIEQFKHLLALKLAKTEQTIPRLLQNNNPIGLLQLDIELLLLLTKMSKIKN